MTVEAALVELRIPGSGSLKDKRRVVRGLIDAARRRFGASVAEVGDLDLLRRAEIGIAVVSGSPAHAEAELDALLRWIEERPDLEVAGVSRETIQLR